MLRLHTFGDVHVVDESGLPLSGAATQRRLLALLSALAAAGDAGLSRDKIVALLWPDADAERARHSLTQALYSARRATGDDGLFDATAASVRLDPSHISSDVRDFERLLDEGELEEAVSLYRGPFLDGLFITGSPEFEQWASAQRARLLERATHAMEALADSAEARGDQLAAVRWRRERARLLPLDAGSAVKLMTALAAVGDRAGAIKYARVHAALIREELGLDPDPRVEGLAAELRRDVAPAAEVVAVAPMAEVADEAPVEERVAVLAPAAERPVRTELATPRATATHRELAASPAEVRIPLWLRWAVLAIVVVTLVGVGVLIGRARRDGGAELEPLPVRQRVVVAPFRVVGADRSLTYLRDGMVELLSSRLADDSLARSVDAGAVLGAWRAAGLAPAMDVPRDTIAKLATRLGAERVVVGSVVGTPARTVLSATTLTLPSGVVSAQASVAGPIDSLATLVDRLAARLLASQAGQEEELSRFVSRSLPAVRSYLAGQAALREGGYAAAVRAYGAALRRDSTFALAALHEAIAADRLRMEAPLRHGVSLAWQSRDLLGDRDEAQLLAFVGPHYPALPFGAELGAAWQHMVDLAPASAESWYELARRLAYDGAAAGIDDARTRAIAALQRALAADSTHRLARDLLTLLSSADTVARGAAAQWRSFERLMSDANDPSARSEVVLAQHALAVSAGAWERANEATARLRRLQPGARAWLRLRVLDGVYGGADAAQAASAASALAAEVGDAPRMGSSTSEGWLADACVLAQWRLARGDTAQVAAIIARLRAWDHRPIATTATAAPLACAELLDGSLAVRLKQRDARARVARLDSLAFTVQSAGDAAAYAPIAVARLFQELGDVPGARRSLQKAKPVVGGGRYRAAAERYDAVLGARAPD